MEYLLYFIIFLILIPVITSIFFVPFGLWRTPLSHMKWMLLSPLSAILYIITYILAPFLAIYSVIFNLKRLPYPLDSFHTVDDDLDGGQHQLGWPEASGFRLIWQRTMWMWRNPAATFETRTYGFKSDGYHKIFQMKNGHWDSGENNYELIIGKNSDNQTGFSLKVQIYITKNRFIRIWYGWAMDDAISMDDYKRGDPAFIKNGRFKFRNQFHPYRKIDY